MCIGIEAKHIPNQNVAVAMWKILNIPKSIQNQNSLKQNAPQKQDTFGVHFYLLLLFVIWLLNRRQNVDGNLAVNDEGHHVHDGSNKWACHNCGVKF